MADHARVGTLGGRMRSRSHAAAVVVSAVLLVALGVGCDNSDSVQSAVTSVSADGILNPALKRIVSGLEARGIAVTFASVVTDSPLELSVTSTSPTGSTGIGFIQEQMEREAVAEWVRDPRLSFIWLMVADAHGEVSGRGKPRSGFNFDPDAVPPAKLDRAQAADLIAKSAPSLLPSPLKLASVELRDDVLGARLLHIEVVVPDFEKNAQAYQQAFIAVEYMVNDLNQSDGTAVGVQCMQALDEQGRLLFAAWLDFQLGRGSYRAGLTTNFRPRFFPHPPFPTSTTTSTASLPERGKGALSPLAHM